eukprot:1615368-Rhodomonas_salina.1
MNENVDRTASSPDGHAANKADPIGILVVLGSPCAGKGTQCKKLAASTGALHLSTGDIFRDAVTRGTELGARVQEYLQVSPNTAPILLPSLPT